jgi:diguanylate cyclase (GGDEF)-like protein
MPIKKKPGGTLAKPAKRRKTIVGARKKAGSPAAASRSTGAADRARQTIRTLRAELARALQRIEELQASADTDFLLNILNRRGFERELNRSIGYIKRYRASGALIVFDVDRLKPVNDAFGHAAGDQVLTAVVAVMQRHVRVSDLIGRLGGDEFALFLWNLSETDARAKAGALEQAIDALTFEFDGRMVTAGASAGVAILDPHMKAATALQEADSAMYVRKAQRRREA